MWRPTDSRKGVDDHCWMKANRSLSTPWDLPVRLLRWLFIVTTTLLQISCNNIAWCTVWLEKTPLHCCFQKIQRVIGLTNFNTTWALALIGVEWILPMVEKTKLLLSPMSSPPSDVCTCQLGPAMITDIHFPTWLCLHLAPGVIAIGGQPHAIVDGSLGSTTECIRLILFHLGTLHN